MFQALSNPFNPGVQGADLCVRQGYLVNPENINPPPEDPTQAHLESNFLSGSRADSRERTQRTQRYT